MLHQDNKQKNELRRRIAKELFRAVGLQCLVFALAFLIGGVDRSGPQLSQFMPLRDHPAPFILFFLLALVGVNACLALVQTLLDQEPWSARWSLWKLVLEIGAGLSSATLAILSSTAAPKTLAQAVEPFQPWLTRVLPVLLLTCVVGVPILDDWLRARRFYEVRSAKSLLARLEKSFDEQLDYLPQRTTTPIPFRLAVQMASAKVQPLALPLASHGSDEFFVCGVNIAATNPTTHEQMCRVLRDARGQLLLMSEQGGGKSTQAFELGRTFVAHAQREPLDVFQGEFRQDYATRLRFPVLLDLSTWKAPNELIRAVPFREWLISVIMKTYGMRRKTASSWLRQRRFLPLLDTLDVFDDKKRLLCVEAINAYLTEHPDAPLVVCCRNEAYASVLRKGDRLRLRQAVVIQPLMPSAVYEELKQAGSQEALRAAAQVNPCLLRKLQTPLLLSLAMMNPDIVNSGGIDAEAYVRHLLRTHTPSCTDEEVHRAKKALTWLGFMMKTYEKLSFTLEDLQQNWLPTPEAQQRYGRFVLSVKIIVKVSTALLWGLATAQVVTSVYELGQGGHYLSSVLYWPSGGLAVGPISRMIIGLIGGIGVGAGVGSIFDSAAAIVFVSYDRPAQRDKGQTLLIALFAGMVAAIIAGLLGGLGVGLIGAIIVGVTIGLIVTVISGLGGGLGARQEGFHWPTQGLLNSVKSAVLSLLTYLLAGFLGGGLLVGSIVAAAAWEEGGVSKGITDEIHAVFIGALVGALIVGLIVGLENALANGGAAALQHVLLSKALTSSRMVPSGLVRFLTQMRDVTLLRREGRGYTFLVRSRMLRDCFSDAYDPANPI